MLCLVASLWQQVPGWRGTRSHSGKFLSSQPVSLDFSSGRDARSDWSGPGLPCCLGWRVLPGPSSRWFRSARSRRSRTTNKWGRTIGLVWAWATLLLGVESLAWPIITMVQISSITTEPNDEQMGTHDRTGLGLGYPVAWGGESCLAHHHDGSDQLDHDGAERRTNGDDSLRRSDGTRLSGLLGRVCLRTLQANRSIHHRIIGRGDRQPYIHSRIRTFSRE